MEEETMLFDVIDDDGNKMECEVLFTFTSEDNNKNYMLYTDNSLDDEGNIKTYVATYDEISENTKLSPVTSDEELEMVEKMLKEYEEHLD